MEDLISLLSQEDKDLFYNYISEYHDTPVRETEYLLRFWNQNKQNLFHLMRDSFMLEREIDYNQADNEIERLMDEKLYSKKESPECWAFYDSYNKACSCWYRAHAEKDMSAGAASHDYYQLLNIISQCLINNIYDGDNMVVELDGRKTKITTGMKAIRALSKLTTVFGLDRAQYEQFRIAHSMCLNQRKIKGSLHLSIHPMDYITMSDNDYGWDSCMGWMNKGEYRLGTVEMMNSPCIVVAYIDGEEPWNCCGDDGYWTNKKWRELFIVDPDCIMEIKPYPYENKELTAIVLKWLKELAERTPGYGPYYEQTYEFRNSDVHPIYTDDGKIHHTRFMTTMMYNDVYGEHLGYLSMNAGNIDINYSGPAICMTCGAELAPFGLDQEYANHLECPECGDYVQCARCGEWINEDYANVDARGNVYCEDCWEYHVYDCDECGNLVEEEEINKINLCWDGGTYCGVYIYVCDDCLDSSALTDKLGPINFDGIDGEYWVDIANVTAEGGAMFGYYSLASFNAYRAQFGLAPLTEEDDEEDEADEVEEETKDPIFVARDTNTNEFHIVDPFTSTWNS